MRAIGNGSINPSSFIKNNYNPNEMNKVANQFKGRNDTTVYYGGMKDLYEGKFVTQCCATIESKYGYAAEFDSISREFAHNMYNRNYSASNAMGTIITDMEEKYQSLKSDIENNYSGEEKEERLSELDATYDFIMKENVIGSTNFALLYESAINKMRKAFGSAYENAKQTKGSEFAQMAYGGMGNWCALSEEIGIELDLCKSLFEQLKESLENIHKEPEKVSDANALLKKITAGLTGINEKKKGFTESKGSSAGGTVKEIDDLIEKKAQIYSKFGVGSNDDSEKYQSFLENKKQSDALDEKLSELLKSLEK